MFCKKLTTLLMGVLFLGAVNHLHGQSTSRTINAKVEVTYAEYLGSTPELRTVVPVPSTDPERRRQSKLTKKPPRNFIGRGKNTVVRPDLANQGPDPVWQKGFRPNKSVLVEPLVNVDGLFSNFGSPHDPSGVIGKDHYVQAINATTIGVFSKTGVLLNSFAANTLWSGIGFSSAGDPIVLYDQEAERWLITEFPSSNKLLVAVSATSDPMGSWDAWSFSTPVFPDYPKYGIWNNAYSVTTNEEGPGELDGYFIDRQAMLNGNPTVAIQRISVPGNTNTEAGFFVSSPVNWSGLTPPSSDPMMVALNDSSWGNTPQDAVEVYSFDINWTNPSNTVVTNTTVVTAPYDAYACAAPGFGFQCVPQKGGGGLDGIPEVIMHQVQYRNFGSHESMVMNFMTDVDGNELSGIRWIEMRRTPGNDWSVYQEGTFAPADGLHRFMGSIAMDGSGNIGLGYNVSSSTTYVGVRFTGRRASDPLGEMTVDEYVAANGANTINSGGRFGDYAHMSIDPTNDRTFWYTTEYAKSGSSRTRIVAFELRKDSVDVGPLALIKPINSDSLTATETIQVSVKNFGVTIQDTFPVGYVIGNGVAVIDTVVYTLLPDSVYIHTFTPTVDLSVVGNYPYKIFTGMEGDLALLNDTLRGVISKYPKLDAGISGIVGGNGILCGSSIDLGLSLTNYGTQVLNSATVEVILNGVLYQTINWTGVLASGITANIPVSFTGLISGINHVEATVSMPNGQVDENAANNTLSREITAILNGGLVKLLLKTDNYPEETTWKVTNANGEVLYSGGPYDENLTVYTEEWCLDPNACYVFQIADSYGDGICCNEGSGNYSIVDANNYPLAAGTGEFGSGESTDFCATFDCMLTVSTAVLPETTPGASNGTIMLTPANGVGPYQYSIDGGVTFQSTNMFIGLTAGEYKIVVTGAADCSYEETVTLIACTLDFTASVVNATTGVNNGKITVTANNGLAPYKYSKNGGVTYQNSNAFNNLAAGTYNIVVKDANGCTYSSQVVVDVATSSAEVLFGQSVKVFPNPTSSVFTMNVSGIQHPSVFLRIGIYDATGKMMYESNLTKFDQTYRGVVSLNAFPSGVYYVRFIDSNLKRLVRVVKE